MKRVFLFLLTNIAIIIVLSIVLSLLGVEGILDEQGVDLDYESLLVFAAVFGFGGSFISLGLSKWMAKRTTGAQVIDQPKNDVEAWLVPHRLPSGSGGRHWYARGGDLSLRRPERVRNGCTA